MNQTAIDNGLLLMDAHINALNERNAKALAATLHFPHHRLSGTEWKTWENADHYYDDFLQSAGNDLNRSTFENIEVLDASKNKVHLDAEIYRFDADDQLITRFRSLWVIINIDGIWAAKVRSSFAAKKPSVPCDIYYFLQLALCYPTQRLIGSEALAIKKLTDNMWVN